MIDEKRIENRSWKLYHLPATLFCVGIVLGVVSTLMVQTRSEYTSYQRRINDRKATRAADQATATKICRAYPREAVCQAYAKAEADDYDVITCFGQASEVDRLAGIRGNKYCPKLKVFPIRLVEAEFRQKVAADGGVSYELITILDKPAAKAAAQRVNPDDLAMAYQGLRYFITEYVQTHSEDDDPLLDLFDESDINVDRKTFQRYFGWMEPHLPLKEGGDEEAFYQLVGLAYGLYQRGAEVLEQHNQAMLARHGAECDMLRAKSPKYLPHRCLALAALTAEE